MVRPSYRLPFSLSVKQWDISLLPQSSNGLFSLKRPVTLKVLIIFLVSVLAYLGILFRSPLVHGGILTIICWTIGYFGLVVLLCSSTKTKQIGFDWILPSIYYMIGVKRNVMTHSINNVGPALDIIGIKGITNDNYVVFSNNEIGEVFEIVGYASILMFQSDLNAVIDATDTFGRNITQGINLTYDTQQAPQRVDLQLTSMRQQYAKLKKHYPKGVPTGLKQIMNLNYQVLDSYVGQQFKSTHQYLVVRGPSRDLLDAFDQWLNSQLSGNYLRSVRRLEDEETGHGELTNYFANIYQAPKLAKETGSME